MSGIITTISPARVKKIEQAVQDIVICLGAERSDDPFCIKDIHSAFLYANPAYKTLFGMAASCDLKGRTEAAFSCDFADFAAEIQQHEQRVMFQKHPLRAVVTCPMSSEKQQKYAFDVVSDTDFPLHFPASRVAKHAQTAMTKNQGSLVTCPIHRDTCQKYTFELRHFVVGEKIAGVYYRGKKAGIYIDPDSRRVFFF